MKKLVIIQTRMDSSRLPGKAVLDICGKPSLQWVIERCQKSKNFTVVATTNREVDDPIEALCEYVGVKCYRYPGDVNDVLGRFHWVCEQEKFKAGHNKIVRVTADCLGIDSETINEVFDHIDNTYAYADVEKGYPPGYGCEGFTWRALQEANKKANTEYDREHVTPYIKRSQRWANWKIYRYENFNLELNTLEDYQRIKNIYGYQNV